MLKRLCGHQGKRVKKALADKAYDTHRMFNQLKEINIEAGIIPRKGSKVRSSGSARDDAVIALRKMDKSRYKRKIDYPKRNVVESFFLQFLRAGLVSMW